MSHDDLERVYREHPLGPTPTGLWQGRTLGFFQHPGARRLDVQVIDRLMFVWPRFGIDFERRLWWFVDPRLALGRFRLEPGRSRWRDAEVLQVHYDGSRLPGPVRRYLYDELKPLDADTVLGIGGVNDGPGRGDHFFFVLNRP